MDMLNADLAMKNEARSSKRKGGKTKKTENESEASFHFIAFLPITNNIWKLDGLERQPQNLGMYERPNTRLTDRTA
jgi:ubiquitin carboxyl-terminal hydrolase L5